MKNNLCLTLLLLFASSCVAFLVDGLITDEMWALGAPKSFSQDVIEELIKRRSDLFWQTQIYLLMSVWLLVKIIVSSLIIRAGFFFFEVETSGFSPFRIVLLAWFVYLIPDIVRVCWFTFINTDYSPKDVFRISNSYPTDLILDNLKEPYSKVLRPFRSLNMMEIVFCIALSHLLNLNGLSFWKSAKVVFSAHFFLIVCCCDFYSLHNLYKIIVT